MSQLVTRVVTVAAELPAVFARKSDTPMKNSLVNCSFAGACKFFEAVAIAAV